MQVMLVLPFFVYSTETVIKQFALDGQIIASIMFCSHSNGYSTYTKAKPKDSYLQLIEACKNACDNPQPSVSSIITAKKLLIIACEAKQEGTIVLSLEAQKCIQELRRIVEPSEVAVVPYLDGGSRDCRIELRSSGLHWCAGGAWKSFSRR